MAKLGYTWYPKDWGNSDAVFELTLIERGLYRELIDMAMLTDNKIVVSIKTWSRKFGSTDDEIQTILTSLEKLKVIEINNDMLFIPSCEPRLNLVRGGSKGGQNKPTLKPTIKPTLKPTVKPIESLPSSKRKEIEKEIESKVYAHETINVNPEIEFEKLRLAVNNTLGVNHSPYNRMVQLLITNLFASGVTIDDIRNAMENAKDDDWHKKKNFKSCGPNKIFEQSFIDRYNYKSKPEPEIKKYKAPWD